MGKFIESIFNPPDMEKEQARQRNLQSLAQARADQQAQDNQALSGQQLAAGKTARGQRLLLSSASGGAGSTLGTA